MPLTKIVLAAGLVLLALIIYALYLSLQLFRQKQRKIAVFEAQDRERGDRDQDARQSIQIIARALVQKDLTATEAAMRIGFLSQKVIANTEEAELFSVFLQLAAATSHIPILDDWATLERSEKRRLNIERESIEKNYAEFIQSSAKKLIDIRLNH